VIVKTPPYNLTLLAQHGMVSVRTVLHIAMKLAWFAVTKRLIASTRTGKPPVGLLS